MLTCGLLSLVAPGCRLGVVGFHLGLFVHRKGLDERVIQAMHGCDLGHRPKTQLANEAVVVELLHHLGDLRLRHLGDDGLELGRVSGYGLGDPVGDGVSPLNFHLGLSPRREHLSLGLNIPRFEQGFAKRTFPVDVVWPRGVRLVVGDQGCPCIQGALGPVNQGVDGCEAALFTRD